MRGDRAREGGPWEFHPSKRDFDVTVVMYHTWIRPARELRILVCVRSFNCFALTVTRNHGLSIPSRSPRVVRCWSQKSRERTQLWQDGGVSRRDRELEIVTNEAKAARMAD